MDTVYYLLIASIIATIGIGVVMRQAIKSMYKEPENREKIQTEMFIQVAIVEIIPLICIVLGYLYMEQSDIGITLPLILVLLTTFINGGSIAVVTSKLRSQSETTEQEKEMLATMTGIGIALVLAIPIVSIVSLLIANSM